MTEPALLQPWERAATRELTDILYQLASGVFETKEALAERMRKSAEAIELVGENDADILYRDVMDMLYNRGESDG